MCIWFSMPNAANFALRFGEVKRFPCQLLWVVESSESTPCKRRAEVAERVLRGDHNDDPNAMRAKTIFADDLAYSASTGKCSARAYRFFSAVRRVWLCDTQHNESANSVVQGIIKAAPNISMSLAGTRFTLKQTLCQAARDLNRQTPFTSKRKALRAVLPELVDNSVNMFESTPYEEVIGDDLRWRAPSTAPFAPVRRASQSDAHSRTNICSALPQTVVEVHAAQRVLRYLVGRCRFGGVARCQVVRGQDEDDRTRATMRAHRHHRRYRLASCEAALVDKVLRCFQGIL